MLGPSAQLVSELLILISDGNELLEAGLVKELGMKLLLSFILYTCIGNMCIFFFC